jgi:ATP-dependent Clp protease protease subunit
LSFPKESAAVNTAEKVHALYQAHRKPTPAAVVARKGDVAEVYVYGEIGTDVTPESFASALASAKGAAELRLYVNSPGGSVFGAKAMMAQLDRFGGKVVANVDGIAASAASFLILAADLIEMAPESVLMIHLPVVSVAGNADDLRSMAGILDKETESLVRMYAARCGDKASPEKLRAMLDAETFLNASEALALGLCDRIKAQPARRGIAAKPAPAARVPPGSIAATIEETRRQVAVAERNALLRRAGGAR